jgi:hypothetical protein
VQGKGLGTSLVLGKSRSLQREVDLGLAGQPLDERCVRARAVEAVGAFHAHENALEAAGVSHDQRG